MIFFEIEKCRRTNKKSIRRPIVLSFLDLLAGGDYWVLIFFAFVPLFFYLHTFFFSLREYTHKYTHTCTHIKVFQFFYKHGVIT